MAEQYGIDTFVIEAVKDEPVPAELLGTPFTKQAIHELLASCPVVLLDPQNTATIDEQPFLPFNDDSTLTKRSAYQLRQPSPAHRRSFEIISDQPISGQDEYGNRYYSLNLKGNNFSNPEVLSHINAAEGYIAYGLQESNIIERPLRASRTMRQQGIGTEYIIGLAEPQQYLWPIINGQTVTTEFIDLPEYKRRIIDGYWQDLPQFEQTTDALVDLHQRFKDIVYYISLRAVDTPYRLADMDEVSRRQEVFAHINSSCLRPGEAPLDPNNSDDFARYVIGYVAPSLGKNLGRLHRDLAHRFVNRLNITALGSIVDLDSVHGESLGLGDQPIDDCDRATDLGQALESIVAVELPSDPSLEALGTLSWHYMRSYAEQFPPAERANKVGLVLSALLESTLDWERRANTLFKVYTAAIKDAYCREYVGLADPKGFAEEYVQPHIKKLLNDETFQQSTLDIFSKWFVPECYQFILKEYLPDLATADSQGEQIDVYRAFSTINDEKRQRAMAALITEVAQSYISSLASRLSDDTTLSEQLLPPLEKFSCNFTWNTLIELLEPVVHEAASDLVERLITQTAGELETALNIPYTASIFAPRHSFPRIGFTENHYWGSTDRIQYDHLLLRLTQLDMPHTVNVMEFSSATVRVLANDDDAWEIKEVISPRQAQDSSINSYCDIPELWISYDVLPPYVAVIEVNKAGERRCDLYLPGPFYDLYQQHVSQSVDAKPAPAHAEGQLALFSGIGSS